MKPPFRRSSVRLRLVQNQAQPWPVSPTRAGLLGMWVFLGSLTVLFATSLFACLLVTIQAGAWRTDAQPGLPSKLWVSTLFLLATSVVLECGRWQIRRNNRQGLFVMLLLTLGLGVAFLINQTRIWLAVAEIQLPSTPKALYQFAFGVLTGLHAVHVLGGFIPLIICIGQAFRERYSSFDHAPVTYCAMYWHFLDVMWIIIVSALLLL
ncbi:MAG TPA: cytochrome c oxidase subunit 3 [Methylomirabilota bacterium]|jgi:heme/copper-type cytochrome/quinol oxidase subunit 3|nr:cytochrome c oxidase subunit 3 [Methylomirabilota bacterium]HZT34952.1 cytochrome c oxidase subunit 3 [Nitrososphaera sp.]